MGQPYIGEIRMFGGNFAPAGWAFCDGRLIAISENDTLFNLIGTTYGGDGQETFALPDLRGRSPIHMGTGAGSSYVIGQFAGAETVTLSTQQMPTHSHAPRAASVSTTDSPANALLAPATGPAGVNAYAPAGSAAMVNLAADSLQNTGGGQAHENMQPYLVCSFIISLFGVYPTQN